MLLPGCASWWGTEPVIQNPFVEHYNQLAIKAAEVDPTIQSEIPPPTLGPGRDLTEPKLENRWLLSLSEALQMGIENNAIIRQNAQFLSPNNPVMQSPDTVPSRYDPAIQNKGVLFGARGVDAALSDFDARFTMTMKSGKDQTVDNTQSLNPIGNILENNYTQIQSRIEQQLLGGGIFAINNNWSSSLSNQPAQLFNSNIPPYGTANTYTGLLSAEFRQPLWSGAGREFTSIAGPSSQRARGFSLVSQGIVIAQINKKLAEIDFQENLQNLAREIGDLYWDLYQNYQDYDAEHATSNSARKLMERSKSRSEIDDGGDIAQAEDAYFESRAREEQALSNLFMTEDKLRRLLGLPIDDPRMIYPSDEPREDELELNRPMCLYEALCNRTELTRQKTNLHSLQLQLGAARKLIAPKLDFVSGYGLNGFGNNFYSGNTDNFNSALSNQFTGRETSWNAGFEYSIPLWLRQEKAQVRQLELKILKARVALSTQEDEIARELNSTLLTIKRSYSMSRLNRSRLAAAKRRVFAAESEYQSGFKSNDLLLKALSSRTQAQLAYARNVSEYNKALRDLLYRTGLLLNSDGIALIGIDGLPLLPPPSPVNPFDELPKPSDPDGPPNRTPIPEEKVPGENQEPVPQQKPKKNRKIAEGDGNRLSALPIGKEEMVPGTLDQQSSENWDKRILESPFENTDQASEQPSDLPDELQSELPGEIMPTSGVQTDDVDGSEN